MLGRAEVGSPTLEASDSEHGANLSVTHMGLVSRPGWCAPQDAELQRPTASRSGQVDASTGRPRGHAKSMTGKRRAPEEKVLRFYGINGAHFHNRARHTTVIKVPREDEDKAMYGTKDSAQCFDVASENAMTATRYDMGKFSPCLCHHPSVVDMSVFRRGDDFVVSGMRTQQREFEEQVSKHVIVKHLATLGPRTALGDVTEVRILNKKIVSWVKSPYGSGRESIEYEVDHTPTCTELFIEKCVHAA